jgi:hypothetical protein
VTAGSAATFTTTITPSGAFAGTVTLSCSVATSASPAPTCASTSVQLSGSAVQANITVNTTAPHASVMRSTSIFYALLLPIGGITLLGVGFGSRRRKILGILLIFLTVSGLLLLTSCGGGNSSSGGGGGGGTSGGTPAGAYTVTVTGTSGTLAAQTTTFALTVQ